MLNYDSYDSAKRMERRADKQFILDVANKITETRGTKLLKNEIEGLVHHIKTLNFQLFRNKPRNRVISMVANNFHIQLANRENNVIDVHEYLKSQVGSIPYDKQSIEAQVQHHPYTESKKWNARNRNTREGFKALNTDETNKPYYKNYDVISDEDETSAPVSKASIPRALENSVTPYSPNHDKFPGIRKQRIQNVYLCLDSYQRQLHTDPSVFSWVVQYSANIQQGTVNTLSDNITNIVNIQFNRFFIPYVEDADNVYKQLTVTIDEFTSMSVLAKNNVRYHMMFDSDVQGNRIQLTPQINDEGRFRFYTPVKVLNTITLRFQAPFTPVTFQKDRFNVTITSVSATQTNIVFSENHGVADGERVHITGYNTLAPIIDKSQIDDINKIKGHVVTYISNTVLEINADLTTVTSDVDNISVCFIATRRLIFPVRMEYLV
jgi:hypothetical protein